MADHLEAAAEALREEFYDDVGLTKAAARRITALTINRYLSSLLGELPEEAVEAALKSLEPDVHVYGGGWTPEEIVEGALKAALRSLRDSLVSGRGETNDG